MYIHHPVMIKATAIYVLRQEGWKSIEELGAYDRRSRHQDGSTTPAIHKEPPKDTIDKYPMDSQVSFD